RDGPFDRERAGADRAARWTVGQPGTGLLDCGGVRDRDPAGQRPGARPESRAGGRGRARRPRSERRPTPPERRNPGYPAAHAVAGVVESHFIAARAGVENVRELPPVPGRGDIEAIVDTAFWASLRREEGRSPRISVAYLPPTLASAPLLF